LTTSLIPIQNSIPNKYQPWLKTIMHKEWHEIIIQNSFKYRKYILVWYNNHISILIKHIPQLMKFHFIQALYDHFVLKWRLLTFIECCLIFLNFGKNNRFKILALYWIIFTRTGFKYTHGYLYLKKRLQRYLGVSND